MSVIAGQRKLPLGVGLSHSSVDASVGIDLA
jgi:hypothetical protein